MQTIFFHNVTVGIFVAENSVCDYLLIFMDIYIVHIFLLKHVKNYYNRIVRTDLSLNLSRFHHGGRGLDGDRWWAGLKHYTPGLKMDPPPALTRPIVYIQI